MVVMHVLIALIVSLLMHAAVGAPPSSDPFRPPMTPLVTFGPMHQIFMLGNITSQPLPSADASDRAGKYWSGSPMGLNVMLRLQSSTGTTAVFQLLGNASFDGIPYAELDGYPEVTPLVTHLRFLIPNIPSTIAPAGAAAVADVRFVHLKVPDHPSLMQLPLVYIEAQVSCPLCPSSVTASLYIDMNAYNVMHLGADEVINGTSFASSTTAGTIHIAKLGTSKQPVLKSFGDDFMLDWGYLYLSTTPDDASTHTSSSATATNASAARNAFMRGDATLPPNDPNLPQLASSGYPLIAVMTTFALNTNAPVHFTVGYDEQGMQYYFGDTLYGAWSQGVSSFEAVIEAAQVSYAQNRATVQDFDTALMNEMSTRISPHYARIGALAYRQTFAAIEFTHSNRYQEDWAFLKEISSDGDINTMDVIFPASPLLLFVAPRVVKQLLLPVLHYAINQTWHPYTYPFCPHQLGTYPVANITTSQQEVMPAENTGNMFLLLLAYMQQTNYTDTDWVFEGYWEVLSDWAMYMVETQLPVPPRQTCTDDFAGPLAENTNLAAKCTIALEAYAEMCDYFQRTKGGNHTPTLGWHCEVFHNLALSYAEFWTAFGVETDPVTHLNHSRLAFNQPNTWSTKYNLLWQKMLGLKRPFTNFETLAANEVAYYQTKMHTFGFPMDIRHTYQKLDWMTWGSCLSSNVTEFAELFEGIYRMANETTSRWPLTDLYDTVTADIYLSFRSRPVVGAVFAAMMLY